MRSSSPQGGGGISVGRSTCEDMDSAEDVRDDAMVRLLEGHADVLQRISNLELTFVIFAVFNLMCWVNTLI